MEFWSREDFFDVGPLVARSNKYEGAFSTLREVIFPSSCLSVPVVATVLSPFTHSLHISDIITSPHMFFGNVHTHICEGYLTKTVADITLLSCRSPTTPLPSPDDIRTYICYCLPFSELEDCVESNPCHTKNLGVLSPLKMFHFKCVPSFKALRRLDISFKLPCLSASTRYSRSRVPFRCFCVCAADGTIMLTNVSTWHT